MIQKLRDARTPNTATPKPLESGALKQLASCRLTMAEAALPLNRCISAAWRTTIVLMRTTIRLAIRSLAFAAVTLACSGAVVRVSLLGLITHCVVEWVDG